MKRTSKGRLWLGVPQALLLGALLSAPQLNAANVQPSMGGFIPFVGLGMTGEHKTIDDIELGTTFFISDPAYSLGAPLLGTGGTPYYDIALFDTGAATHILTHQAFQGFNIQGNGLRGTNTQVIGGATGLIELEINDAAGIYVAGLGDRTSDGATLTMNTSVFRGQTSFATLSAPAEWTLPNIVGLPMASHHAIAIRNDDPQLFQLHGRTVRTPQVDFIDLGSGADEGITRRAPLNIRPGIGFVQGPFYIYNLNIDDILGGQLNLHDNPSSPSVVQDQTGVGGSLFIELDVSRGGHERNERQFLFDTGADLTVISEAMAKRLGYDAKLDTPDFVLEVEGSGGVSGGIPGIFLDELEILTIGGNFIAKNVPVAVLDVTDPSNPGNVLDGILGTNVFNGRNIVIDAQPSLGQGGIGPSLFISDSVTTLHTWTETAASASWHAGNRWSTSTIPDLLAETHVVNATGSNQTVLVDQNAVANTLIVGGTETATMTLRIEAGNTLTTFGEAKVEQGGVLHVSEGAHLDTQFINIDAGGVLTGGGSIFAGTGPIHSPVRNLAGRVDPGDGIGSLHIDGDFSNLVDATVAFQLAGTAHGSAYDQLQIDRYAFLGGTLEVTLTGGFTPGEGDMFTLITAGTGVANTFDNLLLPAGYEWQVDYNQFDVTLSVVGLATVLTGDFNGDGVVDAADYTVWRNTLGSTTNLAADANDDQVVDHLDYDLWKANFGETLVSQAALAAAAAVPEPGSILVVLGAVALGWGCRRAQRGKP